MKKILLIMLCMILSLFTVACGSGGNNFAGKGQEKTTSTEESKSGADNTSNSNNSALITSNGESKKILIAYYSNTGTTEKAANKIQELTKGDIFKINVAESYPDDYDELLKVAEKEYYANARPKLAENVKNMGDYDVIFVGYPIWYDTAPMVIDTFLEANNLSGKTIIPFCTSSSSGIEESVDLIKKLCPNSNVLKGLRANNLNDINPWLKKIEVVK